MEKRNKFIVLVTAYNDEKWVEYNLASILNQTYSNYHVMYYDDASSDNTYQKVLDIVKDNPKFNINTRKENKGALFSYVECLKQVNDEDIIVCVSGDDWLFDENVLKNLNSFYNKTDVWMTYGKFYCWDGKSNNVVEANPQNTPYPDFTHKHKLYKKDLWRASHLRTFKGFLLKKLPLQTYKSKLDNQFFDHAADLAISFPCLELCGKEKIGVVDFPTYVYNTSENQQQRTQTRESNPNNKKYEFEIRNRKIYKTLKHQCSKLEKLPQINVIGYFQENNYIPKNFNFVYNSKMGEFDATLITDIDLLPYLTQQQSLPPGKIIADLHESPAYNHKQREIYDLVYQNYKMFDLILTYHPKLLQLPNAKERFCMWRCLNKNIHTQEWPLLADNSLYKIYSKNKNISCISSNKSFLEGHKKRLEFVNCIKNIKELDLYGVGFNPIPGKIDGLKDYRFSIAIENTYAKNECTEKISDCFLTGTIPIYYGCPNIGDFFDKNGIITFSTKKELQEIVKNIIENGDKIYQSKIEAVKNNFKIIQKYSLNIDEIFNKYIKNII